MAAWRAWGSRVPFALDFSRRLVGWATWVPLAICFNSFVAELTFIKGGSMYPFLNEDKDSTLRSDVALNWKLYPHYGLARGMVVTFKYASSSLSFRFISSFPSSHVSMNQGHL